MQLTSRGLCIMSIKSILSLALAAVTFTALPSLAKDKNLMPYFSEPPEIHFTEQELRALKNNKTVYKTLHTQNGTQRAIAFAVHAAPQKIWTTIKNFTEYKNWIQEVKESTIYKTKDKHIFVRFRIEHWLLGKYQYFINHTFTWPQDNWATWTLDESRESDFLSSIGFWRVYPSETDTAHSYVVYSANLEFKKRKLKLVRNQTIKSSLKQASSWVKEYSEN